jgi:hypothetical protein
MSLGEQPVLRQARSNAIFFNQISEGGATSAPSILTKKNQETSLAASSRNPSS